jgi:hypothetical protein
MSNVAQDASAAGWTHGPLPAPSGHARRAGQVALAGMLLAGLLLGGVLLERAAGPGASAPSAAAGAAPASRAVPAFFERNVGQADKHVRYFARTPHATLGLTSTSAIVAGAAGR